MKKTEIDSFQLFLPSPLIDVLLFAFLFTEDRGQHIYRRQFQPLISNYFFFVCDAEYFFW